MVAVVVCNATQRLINTHDMTPMPPGVNIEISQEAFDHPDIQALITSGDLFRPEGSTDPQSQLAERREKEQERVRDQEQFPGPLHVRPVEDRPQQQFAQQRPAQEQQRPPSPPQPPQPDRR